MKSHVFAARDYLLTKLRKERRGEVALCLSRPPPTTTLARASASSRRAVVSEPRSSLANMPIKGWDFKLRALEEDMQ